MTHEERKQRWWYSAVYQARKRLSAKGYDWEPLVLLDPYAPPAMPDVCPVLGIPLIYPLTQFEREQKGTVPGRQGRAQHGSPSLDRIAVRGLYTYENTEVISWRANSLKKDSTLEELEGLVAHRRRQLRETPCHNASQY